MAVSFFPFNSIVVDGVADRAANAENLAAYLAGFFSDGVILQTDSALKVGTGLGMRLQILAGAGVIDGKMILNTASASVDIEAASATLNRIDRVVFRLNEAERLMEFGVVKGAAASSPTAPALTRSGGIYEMCLAQVSVPAGASSIISSYITDTRNDSDLCGTASIPPHMQAIAYGGTGATSAAGALTNLGISDYIVEQSITSDGSSGYTKWSSGKIEQWGMATFSAVSGTTTTTITFPAAFANTKFRLLLTGGRNFASGCYLFEGNTAGNIIRTTTSALIKCIKSGVNYALDANWFAVGTWK